MKLGSRRHRTFSVRRQTVKRWLDAAQQKGDGNIYVCM